MLDEEIAYQVYRRRPAELPRIAATVARGKSAVRDWIAKEPRMEWVEPMGGVVCFPRIKLDSGVDVKRFYGVLTGELKTWVGPGHWFEQDDRYMRVGFGWAASDELERGLKNVSTALARSV